MFAKQGAAALKNYNLHRSPVSMPDNTGCVNLGPVEDCGVTVEIELFSSTRGVLPNLRPN